MKNVARIAQAVTLAAIALAGASPAAAQSRYYMRERIVGMPVAPAAEPTYTYASTYSTTYGTCRNQVQTQPIVKCTRSDGTVVANSLCPSQQSAPKSCTTTSCEAMTAGMALVTSQVYSSSTQSSKEAAVSWCNSVKPANMRGSCFWQSTDGYTRLNTIGGIYGARPTDWASECV